MLTHCTFRVLAVACLVCTAPTYAPAAATPDSPPAPAVGEPSGIPALVQQLGDADFRVREAAGRKLREIGKPAMPALREALTCGDPEICSRADSLLRQIERPRIPSGWFSDFTGWRRNESLRNGARSVEVIEGDRRVRVTEGPAGIEMTVSGDDDGEPIHITVRARDAQDLRAQDADAFAIYERVAGTRGNIVLRNRRLAVPMPAPVPMPRPPQIPRPLPLPAPRGEPGGNPRPPATRLLPLAPEGGLNRPPADDLLELEGRIRRQMRGADVDVAHQDAVLEAMRMLRDIQAQGRMVAPDDIEAQIKRYNALSDAVRQKLEDLNLPGPGDALPPPARARLGISVAAPEAIDAPGAAGGVLVTLVMPGGRGDKIGLKPGDVIRRVNGKSVDDAAALRRTLTDTKDPLVLDVQRDGEPIVVKEKAEERQ